VSTNQQVQPGIGLLTAIALVVGNMIGSGLFLLPASLAPYGAAAILGWGASACGALALACVFARLSRWLPRSGGPYAYAREAFGDGVGFTVAWSYWISIWCGNAAIAIAFAGYFDALLPAAVQTPLLGALTAVGALWVCTLANALGVRSAGRVQLVTTVLKLFPLIAIAAFAIPAIEPAAWQPFNRSEGNLWSVLAATVALTLWAFLGVESATIPADNVRDPERTIPRATLIGATLAIVVTVCACMAVVGLLPADALAKSSAPFADAAARLWGARAGTLFALVAAIACFGALNGWVLVQGQVPLAAARDRVFPTFFAREDVRGTPIPGLILSSALASLLVVANYQKNLIGLFTFSILLSTAATLLPYVVCSAAQLRWPHHRRDRSHARLAATIAFAAFAFSVGALIGTGSEALFWGAVLVCTGWPVYRVQVAHRRSHSRIDSQG
jgi:APA family basic amino acid/polyamine antiporter